MTSRGTERRAQLGVVVAALLFGSTFVVMRDSVNAASPTAFLCARFGVGAVALLGYAQLRLARPRGLLVPSLIAGAALLTGYVLQTVGLQYTNTSTSAFITYMLVVLVPVFAAIQHRALPAVRVVLAVAVTTVGLWLLTGGADHVGKGELLTLGCAAAYALHILLVGRYANRFNAIWFTGMQLAVVSAACFIPGLLQGGYAFGAVAWRGALYTGIGASAIALTLQVNSQVVLPPTRTALLLMLEPVSAAVIGYGVGERLGVDGWLGGVLILVGVLVAETGPSGDHPQKLNEYGAEWPANDPIHGGPT